MIFCISYLAILRNLKTHVGPYITKCFLGKEKRAYSTDIKKTINLIGSRYYEKKIKLVTYFPLNSENVSSTYIVKIP